LLKPHVSVDAARVALKKVAGGWRRERIGYAFPISNISGRFGRAAVENGQPWPLSVDYAFVVLFLASHRPFVVPFFVRQTPLVAATR
jgi:hypothetical protein